jgi:hypothetical protein
MRNCIPTFIALLVSTYCLSNLLAAEDNVPTPSCTRIDYSRPQDYLALQDSFGNKDRIQKIADSLKCDRPEQTLAAIGRWINENLKYDPDVAYAWHNFDSAVDNKQYGGCADHAMVFVALARAAGVPAVFVKTMDADWIREFRKNRSCESWRGHVFVEVYLNGRWRLLDATQSILYDEYDPASHLLPGNRYAYDKGADPYELVLSLDWERWKRQTADYFATFDLSALPVGEGRDISQSPDDVYIAANSPIYQALTQRCKTAGYRVRMSFNTDFDNQLRRACGHVLLIACVQGKVDLPQDKYAEFLPLAATELVSKVGGEEVGVIRKQLENGTRVALVYAPTTDSMLDLVREMEIWPK